MIKFAARNIRRFSNKNKFSPFSVGLGKQDEEVKQPGAFSKLVDFFKGGSKDESLKNKENDYGQTLKEEN
jgi:hypothetical protein